MKKLLLFLACILQTLLIFAQSDKYNQAMQQQISKIESAFQDGSFPDLANSFERIGDAEKIQWMTYYY